MSYELVSKLAVLPERLPEVKALECGPGSWTQLRNCSTQFNLDGSAPEPLQSLYLGYICAKFPCIEHSRHVNIVSMSLSGTVEQVKDFMCMLLMIPLSFGASSKSI